MHLASTGGHLHIVLWLAAQGLSVNCSNADGRTSLHTAAFQGDSTYTQPMPMTQACWPFFLALPMTCVPLPCHALPGHLEVVEWLVHLSADVQQADKNGGCALHYAR